MYRLLRLCYIHLLNYTGAKLRQQLIPGQCGAPRPRSTAWRAPPSAGGLRLDGDVIFGTTAVAYEGGSGSSGPNRMSAKMPTTQMQNMQKSAAVVLTTRRSSTFVNPKRWLAKSSAAQCELSRCEPMVHDEPMWNAVEQVPFVVPGS